MRNPIGIWRAIETTPLDEPLPEDVRASLLDMAADIGQLIRDRDTPPEQAAQQAMKRVSPSGHAIRSWRAIWGRRQAAIRSLCDLRSVDKQKKAIDKSNLDLDKLRVEWTWRREELDSAVDNPAPVPPAIKVPDENAVFRGQRDLPDVVKRVIAHEKIAKRAAERTEEQRKAFESARKNHRRKVSRN